MTFPNLAGSGEEIELHLVGSLFDRHTTIKLGDEIVAEITSSGPVPAQNFLGDHYTVCFYLVKELKANKTVFSYGCAGNGSCAYCGDCGSA